LENCVLGKDLCEKSKIENVLSKGEEL